MAEMVECPVCFGKGECKRCDGKGEIYEGSRVGMTGHEYRKTCPRCGGSENCQRCGGKGVIERVPKY